MLQSDAVPGKLSTNYSGICVSFGGVSAPITGVFPNQINVQLPALPPGPVTVRVTANCGGNQPLSGNLAAVTVVNASPEFFTSEGVVAANISNGIVEAYGTGWGLTSPAIPPGVIPGIAAPLVTAPSITLGGVQIPAVNILYAGASPCCAGLYQVDFTLPPGIPPGKLPLVITVDGSSSPPNAYLLLNP